MAMSDSDHACAGKLGDRAQARMKSDTIRAAAV